MYICESCQRVYTLLNIGSPEEFTFDNMLDQLEHEWKEHGIPLEYHNH